MKFQSKMQSWMYSLAVAGLSSLALAPAAVSDAKSAPGGTTPQVIEVTAKRFDFTPNEIHLKQGQKVILRFKTLDRSHGFAVPGMKRRIDIKPGKTSDLELLPKKKGTFEFYCDVFCGKGHDDMTGKIIVE